MSLLFNILSMFVIDFFPSSNQLNLLAVVTVQRDFGDQENKVSHCFHCFPLMCHEVMGPDALLFLIF